MSRFLVLIAIGAAAIHFSGGFKRFFNPRSAKQAGRFLNQTKNTFVNEFNKKPEQLTSQKDATATTAGAEAKKMEEIIGKRETSSTTTTTQQQQQSQQQQQQSDKS
jgi:hypothetical protein